MSIPRFLADEDLRRAIVLATRRLEPGFEFPTVRELGLAGTPDDDLLGYAHANGWLVVSHDVNTMKGFAEARVRDGRGMSGLFLAPQSRSTREIAESLQLIWAVSQAEEWNDRIVYLPL